MGKLMLFLAYLLFLFIPIKQSIHIYQQNRYRLERFSYWLIDEIKRNIKHIGRVILIFLPIFSLIFVWNHATTPALLALLLFIYSYISLKVDDNKVYIKPLVYTNRVRRLLICTYILFILCYIILSMLPFYILIIVFPFLYMAPWLMVFIAGPCMLPIEKNIRKFYIKDAKKVLYHHLDLMKIGITGSYGKTSVKMITHELLNCRYYSFMTPNSYNNMMGITISIREMLKPIHEVFLCEMGADHIHEIEDLARFVKPQMAIVTAIGPQHLQTFKTQENITYEKMQLIENLPEDGIAFLNADDERITAFPLKNKVRRIWFAIHNPCDFQACNIQYHCDGTHFQVLHNHRYYDFTTKLLGEHNVMNILAGIAVAYTMKVPMSDLIIAVKKLPYVEHRLQLRTMDHFTLIDNAYNSNPKGAYDSLEVLKQMPNKRVIITPGFIDLGEITSEEHYKFGQHMATCCDVVILVGRKQTKDIYKGLQSMKYNEDNIYITASTMEAIALAHKITKEKDTVLIENDLPDAFNH